MPNPSHIA
ncbi:hypothetical protein Zm00014a_007873 [Zea mays]|uniref:Uncharacterized protein n=1 Tax=Zea mays TaxID=4577 RepID=A0A3L6DS54_MAIZE|nr:hypothetical protein Zm00014a_007873 [Zea mays]